MTEEECKKIIESKLTYKNFIKLLKIVKECADEGWSSRVVGDLGEYIYCDLFGKEEEEELNFEEVFDKVMEKAE